MTNPTFTRLARFPSMFLNNPYSLNHSRIRI